MFFDGKIFQKILHTVFSKEKDSQSALKVQLALFLCSEETIYWYT